MPEARLAVLALLAALAVPGAAAAHKDYEQDVAAVKGGDGKTYRVVLHFTDGIFFSDPVKLVLYGPAGKAVAETGYCRDIVFGEGADG